MTTTDQRVAEAMARPLEGRKTTLQRERLALQDAMARITAIDEEIVAIDAELATLSSRRPPREPIDPLSVR